MSTRSVAVRLMNLSGDWMTELETGFLHEFLPLFKVTDGVPRAEVESVRVGSIERLVDYLTVRDVEIVYLSGHGSKTWLQVGDGQVGVREFKDRMAGRGIGGVVLNTSCESATTRWVTAFIGAGATAYIAPKGSVAPRDSAIFAASFFAAYLGTTHPRKSPAQRAFDAYRLAEAACRSFVPGSTRSKFYWHSSAVVEGRRILPAIELV